MPDCNLIGDQQDAVFVAQPAQARKERIGWDDVAALALNGLDQDGGHIFRRGFIGEDDVLDVVDDGIAVVTLGWVKRQPRPVDVRVGHVGDTRHGGVKPAPLHGLGGGEGQGAHRAPVEAAVKANKARPVGMVARQFDGGLYRLRAGVGHEAQRVFFEGRDLVQFFAEQHPLLVIEIGRDVNKLLGLLLDGFDHGRVTVARGADGDAGGEVQEAVAVHVPGFAAAAVVHDEPIIARIGGGNRGRIARQDLARLWAGDIEFF